MVEFRWPWICTICAKCESGCPMEIKTADAVRHVRSLRARSDVPGVLRQGVRAGLETGNNPGLPQDDFIFIPEHVTEEIAEEPGFENFRVPIDRKGANILTPFTISWSTLSLKQQYELENLQVKYLWELVADCLVL